MPERAARALRHHPRGGMKRKVACAALVAAMTSAGCLPIPHGVKLTPLMEGTLTQSGRPASGVALRAVAIEGRAQGPACSGSRFRDTTTDAAGRFQLPPVQRRGWLVAIGDQRFAWEVCVRRDDGWARMFESQLHSGSYGLTLTLPLLLTCDAPQAHEPFKCANGGFRDSTGGSKPQ